MHRRILAAGTVVMAVAILYLLAGAIPQDHGRQTAIFESPAFLAMAAAGGILLLAACFRRLVRLFQVAGVLAHHRHQDVTKTDWARLYEALCEWLE